MPQEPVRSASPAAYRAETLPIIRQRLTVAMVLFIVFMGAGTLVEAVSYPARARFAVLLYSIEALAALVGAGACWVPRLRPWAAVIAAGSVVVLTACINVYHGAVGASAERVATVLGCVLNLASVLLAWGWRAQAIAALGTLASFGLAAPYLVTDDALAIPVVVMVAAATQSVCGAYYLDRYRFEAFRRTALQTEEAEIAAALAHVAETLSRHLGQPDVLDRVNQLAIELLGCDWSSVFLLDDRRRAYWLASNIGSRPEVRTELQQLDFPLDSLPLLRAFKPGELITIPDASQQSFVPIELLRRTDASSVLYAPVARGEQIIAVLAAGYTQRTGPFTARQCRLALGIAHATATTLENGRLIADLQGANRLKSEFVATMSHELRTPLNVIMGYTEMLADGFFRPEEPAWHDTIVRIHERALELLELVSATLDMGRLEAGREMVTLGSVDVDALFGELARDLAPLVRAGVTLTWRNELGPDPIRSERLKLKTILKNLAGNALKFTGTGAVEVVAVADGDGHAVFTVRDSGIGIAAQHLPVIFDMFRQVDSSSTRRYGGVGLGLHIAKRLVGLLGGEIAVESTVGVGSTFTVVLPLELAQPAAAGPRPAAHVAAR